jgi:hypothetical protein
MRDARAISFSPFTARRRPGELVRNGGSWALCIRTGAERDCALGSARPERRDFDVVLPQDDGAAIAAVLTGVVTTANHLVGDGGEPLAAFARKAKIPFHAVPSPGKPTPEAAHLHINNVKADHSRLKQWLRRFNGVATKNLPNYLGWRRALDARVHQADPPKWILGAIGNSPCQQITL